MCSPGSERGWFCFGCRRGGSIYDFAALLWGAEPRGPDFVGLRDRLSDTMTRAAVTGPTADQPNA